MKNNILLKIVRGMILGFPAALFLSYYPVISLGAGESMNFELSLALIYLVAFDVVIFAALLKEKRFAGLFDKWQFLILPIFVTMSVFWSSNLVRGVLTVVMMWAIYFAATAILVLRNKVFIDGFKCKFLKWFFGASLLACAWCFAQCLMDVFGVPRDCTLLCRGCTSYMFGFPHPNGFAVEPQFMGNLLLAPTLVSGWLLVKKRKIVMLALFFVFSVTLFLTFSRGAIYALFVALVFATIYYIWKNRNAKVVILWPVAAIAFAFTINLQGVMAELGPTNDTYLTGVSKVVNHLSLGIIDIKVDKSSASPIGAETEAESASPDEMQGAMEVSPVFDGYVEESTEVRMGLTRSALKVWRKDFTTAMFGVGIGGAGEALYAAGETGSPKEIVQNEYASLLLEIGSVGAVIVFVTVVSIVRLISAKSKEAGLLLTLIVAYGVTLFFFSGLPNAIHVYLMPVMLGAAMAGKAKACAK